MMKGYEMNCRICGRQDARIRLCELNTARITKRAHVDCHGHSEYRSVAAAEVDAAIGEHIRHNAVLSGAATKLE